MNKLLIVILAIFLGACGTLANKTTYDSAGGSDWVSIDGKNMLYQGQFSKSTVLMVSDFVCIDCRNALERIEEWLLPELKKNGVQVVMLAKGHDSADLSLWRDEFGLSFDVVADPEGALSAAYTKGKNLPAFFYIDKGKESLFHLEGWSMQAGRTLLADIEYAREQGYSINKVALVDDIYAITGIKNQLELFPELINTQINEQKAQLPDALYLALSENANNSLKMAERVELFKQTILFGLSYQALTDIKTWAESDLGKTIVSLEAEATGDAFYKELEAYAKTLDDTKTPPADHRIELITKIDDLSNSSRAVTEISVITSLAFMAMINSFQPPEKQVDLATIRNQIMSQIPTIQVSNQNIIRLSMLYTYRDLSDAELMQYIDMLETRSGSEFTRVVYDAFIQLISGYNAEVMDRLPDILGKYQDLKGV